MMTAKSTAAMLALTTLVAVFCPRLSSAQTAAPQTSIASSPIMKRIAERGEVVLGHRETSVPYSYINDQQQVEGYSVDFCLRIVDAIRQRLGKTDLKIRYIPVNVTNRIPLVTNGTIDLNCDTTTNTLARAEQVEFSPIIYLTGTRFLAKQSSSFKDFEDLAGRRIAMLQGSTTEKLVREFSTQNNLNYNYVFARDMAEGGLLVQTGRVDAFVNDEGQLKVFAGSKAQPAGSLKVSGQLLTYEPYSIMMQRGDPEFSLFVKATLADVFRSGDAEKIYEKWFSRYGIKIEDDLRVAFRIQALPR